MAKIDARLRTEALLTEELYGVEEASRRTGIHPDTIRSWRAASKQVVDPYLRFHVRELTKLRRRALEGCRCREFILDPEDGLCVKCGHPASWPLYRLAVSTALCYLAARSAEAQHERNPEVVYA